jgi:hypothetical protein
MPLAHIDTELSNTKAGSPGFQVISKMKVSVGRASCPRRLEACTTVFTTIPGEPKG